VAVDRGAGVQVQHPGDPHVGAAHPLADLRQRGRAEAFDPADAGAGLQGVLVQVHIQVHPRPPAQTRTGRVGPDARLVVLIAVAGQQVQGGLGVGEGADRLGAPHVEGVGVPEPG
jgi:hypothetical protein